MATTPQRHNGRARHNGKRNNGTPVGTQDGALNLPTDQVGRLDNPAPHGSGKTLKANGPNSSHITAYSSVTCGNL